MEYLIRIAIGAIIGGLTGYLVFSLLNKYLGKNLKKTNFLIFPIVVTISMVGISNHIITNIFQEREKNKNLEVIFESLERHPIFMLIKEHHPEKFKEIKTKYAAIYQENTKLTEADIYALSYQIGAQATNEFLQKANNEQISNHVKILIDALENTSKTKPDIAFAIVFPDYIININNKELEEFGKNELLMSSIKTIISNKTNSTKTSYFDDVIFETFIKENEKQVQKYNETLSKLTKNNSESERREIFNGYLTFYQNILKLGSNKSGPILRNLLKQH
ncbi:hypothetical protein LEP1GSC202_0340 [Leptospira yanagawae serovar Saopaulo str. Sao Paulo = ATCC 700523]|uniref:Uncharacterized protein n=1 Tax=Leptospira yanagawae serovar Saopaulo str. Sao Paulo = ATCC 700523 TaxID=1249483 RepID=A0A5E8HAN7_9LEPT|nr:hypothetical protein [Leptospira yanagawae]EOQ87912.1 hypothetical protein LEP1GSC202_0340 [Leptospira yanagawae serovar Saopaulo str. Sao Paulo = ATCC 700523]